MRFMGRLGAFSMFYEAFVAPWMHEKWMERKQREDPEGFWQWWYETGGV